MSNMQTEDQVEVVETEDRPVELPEGLTVAEVEAKANQWNASWQILFDRKKSQWEQNYTQFRHFDKDLIQNTSQRTYDIWANIQSEIPHLINSIFTKSEVVKGLPKFDDQGGNAYKINNYVNKMIVVGNQGRRLAADAIQDFLVFGNVITKTYWDNEEIPEFDITIQEWINKYEGKPSAYNLDIFNFAIDPSFAGHDINKAQWCRERIFFNKHELIQLMEAGQILPVPPSVLEGSSAESGKDIRDRIDGISPNKKDKVYVDEFWAKFFWKDQSGKQRSGKFYFWILGGKLVKFKVNIFNSSPYKIARCYRLAHEFFGIGDADVMASLSENINVTHSQGSLLAKKVGQKLTILGPGVGIDQQQLKNKENGVIVVKDMSQIKTENTTAGADLGTLINYKASLKADLSNAVGISDIMRGEQPGDMTATEASILNSNSSARLAMKLANFQDEWLVPIASSFYNLSKQFIDNYSFFIDNQLIELKQEDFKGNYDWIAQGSTSLANRNLRVRQMTEIAQQLAQSAQLAAQSGGVINFPPFDLGKFTQNEIMSLLEIQQPDQYFYSPATTEQVLTGMGDMNEGVAPQMPIQDKPIADQNLVGPQEAAANTIVS